MAQQVFTDCKILIDGYDLSGDHNSIKLTHGAEMKDDTRFGNTTKINTPGMLQTEIAGSGFWIAGTDLLDPTIFGKIGGAGSVVFLSPDGIDESDVCFFTKGLVGSYMLGGQVGDELPFEISAAGRKARLVRGTVGRSATTGTSGNGTAFQLGAVTADQKLYAAIQLISITTGSVIAKIVSDDNAGLATPTDRITFASLNARGAEFATLAGPITDTWYAVNLAFTGGGSAVVRVVFGVAPK